MPAISFIASYDFALNYLFAVFKPLPYSVAVEMIDKDSRT
jgi:hypothetical protein